MSEPLAKFFDDRLCPDCRNDDFYCWEDSGHDVAITCKKCGAKFGLQLPPFNMIERIEP